MCFSFKWSLKHYYNVLNRLYNLILALTDPSFIFQISLGNHALKPDVKKGIFGV